MPASFLDTLGLTIAPPLLAAMSALLQAVGDVFAKRAVGSVSPRTFLTIRWGTSAILYTLLVTVLGAWPSFTFDTWPVLLGVVGGIGGPVLAWLCFSRALQLLDVSVAAPTRGVSVVLSVILSVVLLGERMHVGIALGTLLLLAGVYLVQRLPRPKAGGLSPKSPPDRTKGILLVLAATVLWGFVTIVFKVTSQAMPVVEAAWFRVMVPATVFALALGWTTLGSQVADTKRSSIRAGLSLAALTAIVLSGLTTDLVGWSLRFAAYRTGDLVVLSPIEQTGPIWIAVFAAVFLRERITWSKAVGIALVVVGAVAITWPA